MELADGPANSSEMITRYVPAFQSKTSPVDVFSDGDAAVGPCYKAGHIESLDDVIPQATWDD